jgi:hypothetical protein
MRVTTRIRPRLAGLVGIILVLVLPAALGAAYIGAVNAGTFEERNLLWQVVIGLCLLIPLGPLLIIFGTDLVTRPDPEALAKVDKLISELEFANQQAGDLYSGLSGVRDVAEHMRKRIDETAKAAPPQPNWRR